MPYTYDEYMATLPTQNPDQGTRSIGGGFGGSVTGQQSYQYNPNWSTQQYMRENLKQDFSTPQGVYSMHSPVSAIARAYGGRSAKKRADAERREWKKDAAAGKKTAISKWIDTFDPTSRTAALARQNTQRGGSFSIGEADASFRQEGHQRQREAYGSEIDAYFADPARAGWQRGIVQNRLQNDLANVQEDFDTELTGTGQQAAGRGLKGGSVDVENRGAVARTRDTRAIQAGADADSTLADFGARDRQSRAQLHGLVNSGDIGSSDALRASLESIHSATSAEGARYAGQQRNRQVRQFGDSMQSQAYGGGLSAIANSINQNPGGYSWMTGAQSTQRGGW